MKPYPNGGALQAFATNSRGSLPPLKDLVAGIDLPALVAHYAGPGKHSGGKYLFQCPNPSHADSKPSFSVFTGRGGAWRCHCLSQCGHIGDALDFMRWQHGCETGEAVKRLREWANLPAPLPYLPKAKSKQAKASIDVQDPGYSVVNDAAAMAAYLASREWPTEVVEAFGLQVVRLNRPSESKTLRVLHPFTEYRAGEWRATSWQARRLDNAEEVRWLGPRNASLPLYNLRALDTETLSAVVVCEGPADTVTAWLATRGIEGLAVVGVAGAQAWRREWRDYFAGVAVVIAGDNDPAGEAFTLKVANDLRGIAGTLIAACPPEGVSDLTDMAKAHGLDAVRTLLTEALPIEVPAITPTTTAPGDEWAAQWALLTAHFPTAFTVCKVCATPTPHAYCDKCSALTRRESSKPLRWAKCDHCGEHTVGGHGSKCRVCGEGHRVNCEVQP
jgi:hypothetical protein